MTENHISHKRLFRMGLELLGKWPSQLVYHGAGNLLTAKAYCGRKQTILFCRVMLFSLFRKAANPSV